MDTNSPGRVMRAARRARDLTQAALARRIGYARAVSVCELERGQRVPPYRYAAAIERVLGTPRVEAWGYDRKTRRLAAPAPPEAGA